MVIIKIISLEPLKNYNNQFIIISVKLPNNQLLIMSVKLPKHDNNDNKLLILLKFLKN